MSVIDELLLCPEPEFLGKAYQKTLGRHPDPQGAAHYQARLRTGSSRVEVLADLLASPEARTANRPGLDELRELIAQTGAGLKGWRKWLATPLTTSRRLGLLERLIAGGLANAKPPPARDQATYAELAAVKAALARIEARLAAMDPAPPPAPALENGQAAAPDASEQAPGRITVVDNEPAFTAGERRTLAVEVENRSDAVWQTSADQPIFLSYHWYFENGELCHYDGERTALAEPVATGESRRLRANVQPPGQPGNYLLEMTMVMEGRYWFEERGLHVHRLPVGVVRSSASIHSANGVAIDVCKARGERVSASNKSKQKLSPCTERHSFHNNVQIGFIYYYVDHTVLCPANTGMQRVVRMLSRSLLQLGEDVRFVKWGKKKNGLVY
jgi:hypothetical protein